MFSFESSNPFAQYKGIYTLKTAVDKDLVKKEIAKLDLDIYKTGVAKTTIVSQLVAIYNLYNTTKPDTRLSRVFSLIGLSESDVSKISGIDVLNSKEIIEYWELTTKKEDFNSMGVSKHWTSCYATGYHKATTDAIYKYGPVAILRQMDKKGELLRRFVIYSHGSTYYPGEYGTFIKDKIYCANAKGLTAAKAQSVARLFCNDKATKLTEEEFKVFDWKKL